MFSLRILNLNSLDNPLEANNGIIEQTTVIEMEHGSLLKIFHVAVEDKADELSELDVTNKAIGELDELVVDNEFVCLGELAMADKAVD
jgi:hypothetical protein